ncbi:hypothetical protein [Paenibacillus taichungensis]
MPRVKHTKQSKVECHDFELGQQRNCGVGRKNPKKQSVRLYHRITPFEEWDQSNPGITAIKGFSAHEAAPNVTSPSSTQSIQR